MSESPRTWWEGITRTLTRNTSSSTSEGASVPSAPKSRRRSQWLLAGGIVIVLLVLALVSVSLSQRSTETEAMQPVNSPTDLKVHSITALGAGASDMDVWMTKSEASMQNMALALRKMKQKIQSLQSARKNSQQKTGFNGIGNTTTIGAMPSLPGLPPQPVNTPATIPQIGPGTQPITPLPQQPPQSSIHVPIQSAFGGVQPARPAPPPDNGMLVVHLTPPAVKKTKPDDKSAWLAISFTPAQLLNGLDGATGGQAQQNPQPVLMRITDMTQMPNRYQQDFKECFITAAGYGDISSERVYLRLEKLSCIGDDGQAIEETIDGYVTGEDGKVGMKGRLVSKQGQVLAKALLAGLASGIGTAFTQSLSTQSLSPLGATTTFPPSTAFRSGIYSGVGKALNKLANFYIKQAQKLYPVIEVDAGRSVDVIINKGVRLSQWNKE